MLELFRVAPLRMPGFRVPRQILFCGNLIFWLLVPLALVTVALQLGAWRKEINIVGPFAAETNPPQQSLILAVPDEGHIPWWRQPLIGDTVEKPAQSKLRLRIEGHEMGPPHGPRESIRKGQSAAFSHWGSELIFSLPPGASNTPATVATLYYSIRPRPWVTLTVLISTLLLCWLLYHRTLVPLALRYWRHTAVVRRRAERLVSFIAPAPYAILAALFCTGLVGSIVFLGSSVWALAAGWALPTIAPIRWLRPVEWAARHEPYLGYLLLTLAGVGALTTWFWASRKQSKRCLEYELKHKKLLWCGIPIAVCALVLSTSAMWDGIARPSDPHWANIGGLIPFNDAHGHLTEAFGQAKDGTWTEFALRRPLAAAFRSVLLLFGGFSFPAMLLLQASLLAIAACLASYSVMIYGGIWAGIAFFGLVYIYARIFVPTSLTEPLGLFWSLLSIPFFLASFRTGSVRAALVGFALTTLGLMTRMGSMFTIPALLLWLIWQFGHCVKAKLRIAMLAISILLGVFGVNLLLQKAYGTGGGQVGSNFAYTLCGLTIGTTWDGCPARLAAQGKPLEGDEVDRGRSLYEFAWQNFQTEPGIFFKRLASGTATFVKQFPDVMWEGYGGAIEQPSWLFPRILTAISLIGLAFIAIRRAQAIEITFWVLLWASILASSAVVYYDDGPRTLAVSQPLIALFFAAGMSDPGRHARETAVYNRLSRYGWLGLVGAIALLVLGPWVAHRVSTSQPLYNSNLTLRQGEALVFGGRRMSGFLVIADGQELRTDVPTIHFHDFEAIIEQSGVEVYHGLLHPKAPDLPFGFVFAPPIDNKVGSSNIFIVPGWVLERREIRVWRFNVEPWLDAQGTYWFFVPTAEPVL